MPQAAGKKHFSIYIFVLFESAADSKVRMKVEVEYRSSRNKIIYRHIERSFSTEAYREAQKSLDISANINMAAEASKIFNMTDGKVSFQVATAYKEANALITNSKHSGKWVVTEKEEFQAYWS